MEKIYNFFFPLIDKKLFTSVAGVISLLNPFALLPQLRSCIVLDKIVGVSALMYVLFALMQLVFALVAVKAKNLWMFLSMIVSVLISLSIVFLTITKSGRR